MANQPILTLGERIGIAPGDRVTISYYNDTTEWTPVKVPLNLADSLASALTKQGQNVYLMVNETVEQMSSKRGTERDITKLRALWADLDVKEGGMPSWEAAHSVIHMLSDILNCHPTVVVMSGHGLQPYWEVEDGEINDGNRTYIAGVLKRWGMLVQRLAEIEGGKADSVYDLPRVLRAPGSTNFKNTPVEVSMETDDWTHPVSIREVVEAVEAYGFINADIAVTGWDVVSDPSEWEPAVLDCMWSQTVASQISKAQPSARHPWLMAMATKIESAARNGCITEETYGELIKLLDAKFTALLSGGSEPRAATPGEVNTAFRWARARVASFSEVKLRAEVDYHSHKLYAVPDLPKESEPAPVSYENGDPTTAGNLALVPDLAPIVLDDQLFSYTDTANAERLARTAFGDFIFVPGLGWHAWDGGRYVKDEANSVIRAAIRSVREFADTDPSPQGLNWAQKSLSASSIAAAVRIAETVPEIVVPTTRLDADPLVLCTPGGIVSLMDGHLRDAVPGVDLHTRQTAVTPQFGPMPMFEAFLQQTFGGTDETTARIEYIQRLCGIGLIGEIRFQILPIFSGAGANGKSALLDMMAGVAGQYAAIMPENFLLESSKLEHSTEIFRLRGIRIAIASETRPDGKFNESRVKMLTGETRLSARAMRQDFIDFIASHTIFVALNHPPQVKSGGEGFWRRIRKIDFLNTVPAHERVEGLAEKIVEAEGPAILQWMIEGAQKVLKDGLTEPISIEMSTMSYRAEEDHIDSFLQDCTSPSPEAGFTTTALYATYAAWCRKNGELPITSTALMRDLKSRMNLTPFRTKSQRGYKGLLLHEDFGERDSSAPGMRFGQGEG